MTPLSPEGKYEFIVLGLVPERPISANPGLKFCSVFVFYVPMEAGGAKE